MTRYEIKKKKARQKRKIIISLTVVALGLAMVITALVLEAGNYPWGLLFGTASQNADSLPDPSPIKLDEEDQNVIITEEPSAEAAASDAAVPSDTAPSASADLPGNVEDTKKAPAVTKYVVLGTLKIPVLKVSQNLLEGAGKQMKYGVGHVPSTAAVGQKGNCAISGHRPYPFRYLDQLKSGDGIVIKAGGVTYTYTVYESLTVLPNEVWVLNNIPGEDYALTLITCTPYLVSSHRLIIRARLTDIDGMTPQAYYGNVSPETAPTDAVPPDAVPPDAVPTDSVSPSVTDIIDVTPTETGGVTPTGDVPVTTAESPAVTPTDTPAQAPVASEVLVSP